MSVLLETSLGDIVIDLEADLCPRSCENFLKLSSSHYYKLNAFFSVQKDFLAQTGDPTNTGDGGESFWSRLPSTSSARSSSPYFTPETHPTLKHTKKGTVSFACTAATGKGKGTDPDGDDDVDLVAGSQFFITLKDEISYLDGKHAPFGHVVEGQEPGGTLDKINQAFTDDKNRPLKDIRIRHVVVLEDPFPDPDGFVPPSRSPSPTPEQIRALRLADDEDLEETRDANDIEESRRKADSSAAALTLEMVGDLPFAEIRPPENILFVCKLNPVTRSEDLELIFSRFGRILSCEVIKDKRTGDSLQYAFIEFDRKEDAERAYFKMQNVLVDDRRIWVDFSQSVSKLHGDWMKKRNGGRDVPQGYYESSNGGGRGGGAGRSAPRGGRGSGGGGRHDRGMVFDFDDGPRGDRRNRDRDFDRDRRPPPRDDRDGRGGEDRYRNSGGGGSRDAGRYDRDERDRGYDDRRRPPPRDDTRDDDRRDSGRRYDGRDRGYGPDHDRDRERDRDRQRERERARGDDRPRDRDRAREYDRERDYDRHRDGDKDRDRPRDDRRGARESPRSHRSGGRDGNGGDAPSANARSRSPRRDERPHHSSSSSYSRR